MGPWSLEWLRGKAAKATVAKMAGAAVRGNVITEVVVDRQTGVWSLVSGNGEVKGRWGVVIGTPTCDSRICRNTPHVDPDNLIL